MSSQIPAYKNEIFISYAHLDNESAFQGQNGWINDFHRALEVRVAQLLGRKPIVWRDPKLTGNDLFTETISAQLPQTAVLVTVLSPRYVKSEWCRREFHSFCDSCSTTGLSVGNKSRVFKVVKTPFPADAESHDLQPLLQPLLGYEFFKVDPQSGHFHELDLAFGPEAKADYWLRLDDLAQDITNLLETIANSPSETVRESRLSVYLAETSLDVKDLYAGVRRDLERKGYTVLPQRNVPLAADEMHSFVRDQLSQCAISVHLVGAHYGVVPDGSIHSIVEIQHELAVECARASGMVRLVWLPPGVQPQDERQRDLINRLRSDSSWDKNADLLETSIESLKTLVNERLLALEAPRKTDGKTAVEGNLQRIYLICDEGDRENIRPLYDLLFGQGFEVVLPAFDGEEAEVRADHEDNLKSCDAAIVYHGASHDLFLRRKLREMRKVNGAPGGSRLRARVICMAPPITAEKQNFRTLEATVVTQGEDFTPDSWRPLLSQLLAKGASA